MDFFEVVKSRRSIRDYKNEPIPKDLIEKIIDAGRLAATASNIQPWEFVVITEPELKNELYKLIKSNAPFLKNAPCAVAVFSKDVKYYIEDCSAATQNILLAAKALSLGSCWVAGDKKDYAEKVRKLLKVPDGYKLVSIVVLGYPASDELPKISKRKLEEVIHWNKF